MATSNTVAGLFSTRQQAQEAIQALRQSGFTDAHLGLLSRDDQRSGLPNDPTQSRWEEGSGAGAAAGAVAGTGLGLAVLSGLIPPLGPAIAGGALVALLASAGAGATAGTVIGALIGLGIPEDDASYYDSQVSAGRTLVTVQAADRAATAAEILRRYGADIRSPQTTA